jgi:uncharacterized RDD family membrane protein YckC
MTELVSGEAVVLDIPCAQYPSRIGAVLIDMAVQLVSLGVVLLIIFSVLRTNDEAVLAAVFTTCFVLAIVGYPVVFETLSRGRTLGKMAFGLRVISDDGGPVRFRQALVRGLTGAIEIWSLGGAPVGLLLSIVSVRGKRLGDMFAGTYVIQERMPRRPVLAPVFAAVPPPLAGWAQVAETAGLSDQTAEAASSYLRRYYQLTDQARASLGLQLAQATAAQVSPPPPAGTPPAAYLSAVLAVRRHQAATRLAAQQRFVQEAERADGAWGTPAAPPGPGQAGPPSPWAMPGTQTAPAPPPGPLVPGPLAPGPLVPGSLVPGPLAPGPAAPGAPAPAGARTPSGEPAPGSPGYGFAPPG